MNIYPRSFLRMIVLGNVLVILPLLVAIGYASLATGNLMKRSEEAVHQAVRAGELAHALPEDILHMERILRQYEVIQDPALLDEYARARVEWTHAVEAYLAIPLLAGPATQVRQIQQLETNAFAITGDPADRLPRLKAALATIQRALPALLEETNRLVDQERETFRSQAVKLRERLMAAQLTALGFSILLLWWGRRMVARLWSRFERAVLVLGEGRLDRRIQLKGPEDMQRVGRRLEWLRHRMVKLESERTRIMRHVSHELRTPLTALREGASLLRDGVAGPLTPQQARIAGIMQGNAVRLQGLIDDLLRMQQASHARDQMETAPVRLDQVITQALATFKLAVRDRHVRVSGSLAPLTIDGNEEALATLVHNLISNAIKFSPDGGMVRITLVMDDAHAVLDVTDEGPGVAAEDRERIFEPFYRGEAGRSAGGAGLGLAIAHEYALAHRGSLACCNAATGAHFRARLPLAGAFA